MQKGVEPHRPVSKPTHRPDKGRNGGPLFFFHPKRNKERSTDKSDKSGTFAENENYRELAWHRIAEHLAGHVQRLSSDLIL